MRWKIRRIPQLLWRCSDKLTNLVLRRKVSIIHNLAERKTGKCVPHLRSSSSWNSNKKKQNRHKVYSAFSGLSNKTWTCGLYHPNWLIYLFLAVFAFSEAFCYAKTAFSYSRDILSPCTPDLFMVKDVVKSKYRMIVMWSYFQVVNTLENHSAGRKEKCRVRRRNTLIATCGQTHTERW